MEAKSLRPYFVIIGLMILTSLALAFTVDVNITNEAGIRMALPDRVGEWQGQEILYCQNPACQKELKVEPATTPTNCPSCGGPLGSMTQIEKSVLPPDTALVRKNYRNPSGRVIYASIVLSGKERGSIHRPELCQTGAGSEITGTTVVAVPIEDRRPLHVKILDLLRTGRSPDGRTYASQSYYAYWFVGKGRETPYHLWRMFWMASDRILYNRSHRWAYIAIAGSRTEESDGYVDEIKGFVHDLYPQITLN